jgi:hypothetical protein
MTLSTDLQASFIIHLLRIDDLSFGLGGFDMFRTRGMAFFAAGIELDIKIEWTLDKEISPYF